jgi:uncharacterized membrane protein YedE/YeeE
MSSKRIEEMKKLRMQEYKKKKSHVKYGVVILFLALLIFMLLLLNRRVSGWIWIIGLLIGFTLQRSKFCFAAGFRDPVLVGSTSIMRAIVVAFMIMTVLFGMLQFKSSAYIVESQIDPAGLNTVIGAILFRIGMVIAGGCASGTLMRNGEGFILQWVVLLGFIIGTLLSAASFESWDKLLMGASRTVYIPDLIGLPASIALQLIILIVIYIGLKRYDNRHNMMIE